MLVVAAVRSVCPCCRVCRYPPASAVNPLSRNDEGGTGELARWRVCNAPLDVSGQVVALHVSAAEQSTQHVSAHRPAGSAVTQGTGGRVQ